MRYPVTLTKDDNDTYLVTFPDVPDAVTFGDTRSEALERAADALLSVFDAYMKDRHDIPMPSPRRGESVALPALETSKIELYLAMRARNVGKAELARRLNWPLPQVDRVLDVRHGSRLDQLEAAFDALGKKMVLVIEDADAGTAVARGAGRLKKYPREKTGDRTTARPVPGAIVTKALRQPAARQTAIAARTGSRIAKRAAKKR